jgi:hypothetical protein
LLHAPLPQPHHGLFGNPDSVCNIPVDQARPVFTLIGPQENLGMGAALGRRFTFANKRFQPLSFFSSQSNDVFLLHMHPQHVAGQC